jgi:ribosomal protein S27AE
VVKIVNEYLRAEILDRYDKGETIDELSDEYGLTKEALSRITKGARKAKKDEGEKDDLKNTIDRFRDNGCSIPKCPKCKAIMTEIKEKAKDGTLHYSCGKCHYTDWTDKLCNSGCCKRGLRVLAEQKGYTVTDTDTDEEEDLDVCPNCKGDVVLVKPNVAYCERCDEYFEYEE